MYCIANTMIWPAIPQAKANRLYWLGRYAERVYVSLHLLRRYADRMIEGDTGNCHGDEYCRLLNVPAPSGPEEEFSREFMYDVRNPASIMSSITAANDNAVLLRDEIKSETLAYLQMSLAHIRRCADSGHTNINDLQPLTDHMLSFWGSVDSRSMNPRARCLMRIGKLIEDLDLYTRFEYPAYRLREFGDELAVLGELEPLIYDHEQARRLKDLRTDSREPVDESTKWAVLDAVNRLVTL